MQRDDYRLLYANFRWHVPAAFNIAAVCARRWAADTANAAGADRVAILYEDAQGARETLTYRALQAGANRLSNALAALGVRRGARVALLLPQRPQTAIAHMAVYQMGAVAVPLSVLFGPEALEYRLRDSGAVVAICDAAARDALLAARPRCPELAHVIAIDADRAADWTDWNRLLERASDCFEPALTRAADPALLIYTSGTTGPPKGALMPHCALIGNLPGFVASQNWFPRDVSRKVSRTGDVFWSPADWAWTGGLMDALLPTLYFGRPIVGSGGRFQPDRALDLMRRYRVTHCFLFPTALKQMMRSAEWARGNARDALALRAIMSAGETVGSAVFEWARATLGLTINEMFGQTEINYIVGASHERWPARSGSMGRPYPGHRVAVIDDDGNEAAPGAVGEVAVHRRDIHGHPDPVFFLGYWNNPAATRAKFTGDPDDSWCRTGDLARRDDAGYLWYQGRADDVFKSSGYRIGPGEIENCLIKHPAVINAAVVPKPDAERGAIVKAFVVLAAGFNGDARLADALRAHVRGQLAPYEYPKEIEFVTELPMTTTGKVQRRMLRELEAKRAAARSSRV
jgi:acetyl-CoA synthetase